jgi:hypothetical protein
MRKGKKPGRLSSGRTRRGSFRASGRTPAIAVPAKVHVGWHGIGLPADLVSRKAGGRAALPRGQEDHPSIWMLRETGRTVKKGTDSQLEFRGAIACVASRLILSGKSKKSLNLVGTVAVSNGQK